MQMDLLSWQALREGFIVPLPLAEEFFALVLGRHVGVESFPRPGSGMSHQVLILRSRELVLNIQIHYTNNHISYSV